MKKLSRFWLFASTLITSAWNQWKITGRIQWRAVPKIVLALRTTNSTSRRPGSVWWKRIRGCAGRHGGDPCPVFDRKRWACGRIGEFYRRGDERIPIGCGCSLIVKAGSDDPVINCWLWTQTGGEAGIDWARFEMDKGDTKSLTSKKNGQSTG